ncbi:MAG TPA: glycoside hydrolase family 88 protein [Opitutaceae bacterium]|nr:glycoside hydrolase family 88 protein [Opitutaceae bacterium]
MLRVVARHQLHPLKDGDYAPVATLAAADAARAPDGIAWSYPWGVTLYGLIRSTDATGDRAALDFALEHNRIVARYYAWLETVRQKLSADDWNAFMRRSRVAGLLRLGNLDSCGAMGVQTLEGILRHRDQMIPEQNAVVARIADWIANKQDRLPDGTFWRPEATNQSRFMDPGTIWIDDLYMGCPYLVRWAKFTGDDKFLHDAAQNVINMAARLQDTDGVWFHAYFVSAKKHNPWKWGRANGWAMVATVEILSALPENHPDREKLLEVFRRHVAGVKALQSESGVWHQVLDRRDLWEETSCTAMFAYSIARGVNRGWLPASDMAVARKAFAGICANYITPEGVVKGTCEGTNIGLDLEFYMNRRRPDDDLHGRGVVLLAGTEILNPQK